ncbi:MAG: response regulator transcription factor [Bacteroidetes bacterium]|nr:response regulator transcription factor [Bacteroidota bacterium]
MTQPAGIVFIDNSIHKILKSIDGLKTHFETINVFTNEKDAFDYIYRSEVDLVLLNLDLISNDAVGVTNELKKNVPKSNPFIVVYSDKQEDYIQEMVLNSGADSFINFHSKPAILYLFIKNLLRRKFKIAALKKKSFIIDNDRFLIYHKGAPLQFTLKEFRVIELLFSNTDKIFSKPEIAAAVWHDEKIAEKRTIDVHIYNIRQLLGKKIIQSQKGKGYRINKKYL